MAKNLVLGTVVVTDETLERIYGLDEEGIRCLKKNLKRLYKFDVDIKDFNDYTAEEIEDIRRTAKERHITLKEIVNNIDKNYNFGIKVNCFREELLNKVPEERDFDEIITLLCNVKGMTLNCVKVYREALYDATSNIVKARFKYSDPAETEKK